MKKYLCSLIPLIFSTGNLFAQNCEECGKRSILIYDLDINISRITNENSEFAKKLRFWDNVLFAIASYDKSCLEYMSSSSFSYDPAAPKTKSNSHQIGGSLEYMISGTISGNGTINTLNLFLETKDGEKLVASGTAQFDGLETTTIPVSTAFHELSGGKGLYEIIHEYEKNQRELNNKKNIAPRIELHAPQTNLKQMDAIPVEVQALDCDNKPIKNRKITFAAGYGTLDKKEITTDDDGKGKILYTSPKQSVYTGITANLDYTKAYDRDGVIETLHEYLDLTIGDPEGLKLVRDEAIKRGDEQLKKVKGIFEKYKATPEYSFALNQLLSFSYNFYKDALEKEPEWDIKKDAAEYNLQLADRYLKKLRNEHDYIARSYIRYFILQHDLFSNQKKAEEYNQKLQNASWFQFKIFGSSIRQDEGFHTESNYNYERPINTWNHTSVEDKIKVSYTETHAGGQANTSTEMADLGMAWDLKICDNEEEEKDDFQPAPLTKDKTIKPLNSQPPIPVPGKKNEIEFQLSWFHFPGGGYIPFDRIKNAQSGKSPDETEYESTTFSVPNFSAIRTFSYAYKLEDEIYVATIVITHSPR